MNQQTQVVMRFLTCQHQRVMNVLADVLMISIDDACADMVMNYAGNVDAYRAAKVESLVRNVLAQHQVESVRLRLSGRFSPGQRVRLPLPRKNVDGIDVHHGTVTRDDGVHVTVEWDNTLPSQTGKHIGVLTRGSTPADADRLQLDLDTLHAILLP